MHESLMGPAAQVTAFRGAIPVDDVLVVVGLVVGLALVVSFSLTIGLSVFRSTVETRRDRVRPTVRRELLDRVFATDPEWETWVAGLSGTERYVAESLLEEHLRELDGRAADRLRSLGDALGIPARSGRLLGVGDEYVHLEALTWLTLLRRPEPYVDSGYQPTTPRERATVVRLLQVTGRLSDAEVGTAMLLDGAVEQFSVFGQDTLYRLVRDDPAPLLRRATETYDRWPEPLLAQVLAVCANLETSVRNEELEWLTAALETQNASVRAAAATALGSFGWRTTLRDRVFLERAVKDPSPRVRASVYEMLASWGDEQALTVLLFALVEETHPRALSLGTMALVRQWETVDIDAAMVLGDAWPWSVEHARYDRTTHETRTEWVSE